MCEKVWTWTKILSPHTLFCRDTIICRDLLTFWKTLGKKSALLGQKKCFLGKECTITWYILHIILNQICKFVITRKNDAFVAKIANTRLTKTFAGIFANAERLPTSATLEEIDFLYKQRCPPPLFGTNPKEQQFFSRDAFPEL